MKRAKKLILFIMILIIISSAFTISGTTVSFNITPEMLESYRVIEYFYTRDRYVVYRLEHYNGNDFTSIDPSYNGDSNPGPFFYVDLNNNFVRWAGSNPPGLFLGQGMRLFEHGSENPVSIRIRDLHVHEAENEYHILILVPIDSGNDEEDHSDLGNHHISGIFNFFVDLMNSVLGLIGITIKEFGEGGAIFGVDYEAFARMFSPLFIAFGYSLCLLFIGINLIEKTIKYELMTLKGAVNVIGRILLAKIWIDLSAQICMWIINISVGMTSRIIDETHGNLLFTGYTSIDLPVSRIPVIGAIFNFFVGLFYILPIIGIVLVTIVISFIIIIKLVMRTFEITMLLAVAPMFFACWVSDVTRNYFRKFINAFLSVVFEIVFMAIVYATTIFWVQNRANIDSIGDLVGFLFLSDAAFLLIIISMGIMMIRPPKILRSLISGG
jgi:hypothetical protein